MAVKGATAKSNVSAMIQRAFGSDFVCELDKKLYIWADDGNGEKVQVAISLTCPKNPVGEGDAKIDFSREPGNSLDFENMSAAAASPKEFKPAEISDEEQANIKRLMEKLGL